MHTAISFAYTVHIYILSKTKVKLGGLEVPFKRKNLFCKKNNYNSSYL